MHEKVLKMDGSVLEEKSSFKMLRLSFLLYNMGSITWAYYITWALALFLLLKLALRKLEP